MDISISDGKFYSCENLVLHCHFQIRPGLPNLPKFMANFYEGSPAFQTDDVNPVLVCRGKGIREFEATFACLDILLGYPYQKGIRPQLEKWILANEAGKTRGFRLYLQIRHEGELQDIRIHTTGIPDLSEYFPESYISQVVHPTSPIILENDPAGIQYHNYIKQKYKT